MVLQCCSKTFKCLQATTAARAVPKKQLQEVITTSPLHIPTLHSFEASKSGVLFSDSRLDLRTGKTAHSEGADTKLDPRLDKQVVPGIIVLINFLERANNMYEEFLVLQ